MDHNQKELTIFADESIHDNLGFIMTAFVCSQQDINTSVADALVRAKLDPGKDEFKSSFYMSTNPVVQTLRDELIGIARAVSKVALLISSSQRRKLLGKDALEALNAIVMRNGLESHKISVFFDQGIVNSEHEGVEIARQIGLPLSLKLNFEQDSRAIMGLQVADALAHISAQILREEVTGKEKTVHIGGENTGYEEGTMANLGWALLMSIRYSFFVRPMVWHNSKDTYNPVMNPVIITKNDDPATISMHPDLFGWGVITASNLDPKISHAVDAVFQKLWLGCIH